MDTRTETTQNARRWIGRVLFLVLLGLGVAAIVYRPFAKQDTEQKDDRRAANEKLPAAPPKADTTEKHTPDAPAIPPPAEAPKEVGGTGQASNRQELLSSLPDPAVYADWGEMYSANDPRLKPPPPAPKPPPPPPGRFFVQGYCPDEAGVEEDPLLVDGKPYFACWSSLNEQFIAAEPISKGGKKAKRQINKKPQGLRLLLNADGRQTLAHWLDDDPELRLVLRLDNEQVLETIDPAPVVRNGFIDVGAKTVSTALEDGETLESLCFDNRPPPLENVPAMPVPKPPAANVAKLVEGNTRFALSLLRQLSGPSQDAESKSVPTNLLFSPYSLSIALAMTLGGARGETAKQMVSTLEFQLDAKALHPAFASLAVQLDQAGVDRDGTQRVFELVVANSLWPAKGLDLHSPYLELCKRYYAVAIEAVDFAHELEAAVQTINEWVSTQTRERIPSVLDTRSVQPGTLLVLTNAVYFNAKWKDTFEPRDTRPHVFHAPTGDVQVPMMSQRELFRAAQVSLPLVPETEAAPAAALRLELLEMPYEGERMALTVLMPSEGSLAELVAALSVEELDKLLAQLESEHLALSFPKFELRSKFQLSDALSAMGMVDAFGPKANFKGITNAPLCIDKVLHEATIELDETGTIAAAATAVVGVPYGLMKPKYRKLEINRPFLYLIRDTETGTVLFVGLLYDPS